MPNKNTQPTVIDDDEQWNDNDEYESDDDFNTDWTDTEDYTGGFPVKPRGDYRYEITDCSFSYSQASGNPMLTWEYTLVDPSDGTTFKVWDNAVFNEKNRPRFWHRCVALDPTIEQIKNRFDPRKPEIYRRFIGLKGRAKVGIQKASGEYKERNKIVDILPPRPGEVFSSDEL